MQATQTPPERRTPLARLQATRVLFTSLSYPQYRNYWFASISSLAAQQIMVVAQGWLVYELTGDPLYLGFVGIMTAVPALVLSLLGGVLADRLEIRRLLGLSQIFLAALATILATLTVMEIVQPWHVLIVAFLTGCGQAFNNPARQALYPQLVDRKDLLNAVSLNSMSWQGTRVFAPALGGILIAIAGAGETFYACAIGYLAFTVVVFSLRIDRQPSRSSSIMGQMVEGWRYLLNHSLFAFLIGMTFFNSFFGISVLHIFPVFAEDVLDVGPSGLGLMFSAVAAGSLVGLVIAGLLGDFERKGLLIIGGASVYGVALILFSQSVTYELSLGLLFFVGAFSQVYMILVQTILQMRVPDQMRGRIMGIYTMTYNMGPLGAVQAGALAAAFGASTAVFVGGSAIIAFALGVAALNANVRRLAAPVEPATT